MSDTVCRSEGCTNDAYKRCWCSRCYERRRLAGDLPEVTFEAGYFDRVAGVAADWARGQDWMDGWSVADVSIRQRLGQFKGVTP